MTKAERGLPAYRPGQYMQLHIPAYGEVRFAEFEVDEPYASVWKAHHLFDLTARNDLEVKRNYSLGRANPSALVGRRSCASTCASRRRPAGRTATPAPARPGCGD